MPNEPAVEAKIEQLRILLQRWLGQNELLAFERQLLIKDTISMLYPASEGNNGTP